MTTPQGEQQPATLDDLIRARLETCNWYGLRSVLETVFDQLPQHPGPPINRMVCADTVRLAVANALGVTRRANDV